MNQDENFFIDLIRQGENERVEFKTRLLNEHDIAKILTAFANTNGGYLLIGVGDKGEILGMSDEETRTSVHRLEKICNSIFSYPVKVDSQKINGRNIVFASVDKAPNHLGAITTATGSFYLRKGDENVKVTLSTRMFSEGANEIKKKGEIVGFIAMSFRDEEEPALIDYYNAMMRAAERTKLPIKLTRMDLNEGDFEISQQIMTEIEKCSFVIADFTLSPHNVYFEAGFARGVKKRIIQTARKGTVLQFDVRNWATLFYRNGTELEEHLISKLELTYRELTGG